MGLIIRAVLRRSQEHVQQVTPVPRATAGGVVARVYDQLERDFGMLAPPVTLHSPAPDLLAAAWCTLRESLVGAGVVDRVDKEAVAAAVSASNACPYCVQVHTASLHGLLPGSRALDVAEDRPGGGDERIRAVARWARRTGSRDEAERAALPAPDAHAPELIGTAVTFHYLNRMVNVFLTDSPLPPAVPASARRTVLSLLGRLLRPSVRGIVRAGEALLLLPAAAVPADLGWAEDSTAVAGAFARAAAAVEAAGERSVPAPVRELVLARLSTWDGRPPRLGTAWLDDALGRLPAEQRPVGRLALLTALASYRVEQATIDAVRAAGADDRALVEIAGWASFAAAREIGYWVWTGWTRPASGHRTERVA